jgi:hypothetical protein
MTTPGPAARPRATPGYGIPSEPPDSSLLPWPTVEGWLKASRSYWVCTTRANGKPHAIPVWAVWLDSSVCFSTDPASLKARNFTARPDVVVHLESGDDVCIVEGRVETIPVDLLDRFIQAYESKYTFRIEPGNADFGLYRVRPRVVLAWLEKDFPATASRWTF